MAVRRKIREGMATREEVNTTTATIIAMADNRGTTTIMEISNSNHTDIISNSSSSSISNNNNTTIIVVVVEVDEITMGINNKMRWQTGITAHFTAKGGMLVVLVVSIGGSKTRDATALRRS